MTGDSRSTTDHDTIRRWAEVRRGKPASVKWTTSNSDMALLGIDFPGYRGGDLLEAITWEEFFAKFDEANLALVYQEQMSSGGESHFCKLVSRNSAEHKAEYSRSH